MFGVVVVETDKLATLVFGARQQKCLFRIARRKLDLFKHESRVAFLVDSASGTFDEASSWALEGLLCHSLMW